MSPMRLIQAGQDRASASIANQSAIDALQHSGFNSDGSDFDGFAKGTDLAAKANAVDALPEVADAADRDARFPGAAVGFAVRNRASKQIERKTASSWSAESEHPTGTINPRKYTLGSWFDTNGVSTIATDAEYYISATDLAEITSRGYRGRYYVGIDTRDDVCLQEAFLEAWGASTANGQYTFLGDGGGPSIWLGHGYWRVSRCKFFLNVLGPHIRGAGKSQSRIRGIAPGTSVLRTDGINSGTFEHFGVDTILPYAGAHGGAAFQGGSFDWHAHAPISDFDWFGTESLGGTDIHNVAADYTPRTVTAADMPYIDRAGSGFTPNALRGQMLIVVDDATNPSAVSQVRRIAWNTATRIYIAGRWDFLPSADAKFLIAPVAFGFARWHGLGFGGSEENILTDWCTNFNTLVDASGNPVNVNGMTVRRFGFQTNGAQYPLRTKTIATHTERTLHLDSLWNAAGGTVPIPRWTGNADDSALGPNGLAEPAQPEYGLATYAIGGTLYDKSGGANLITSSNSNNVTVSGTPWGSDDKVGGFLEVVSCAANTGLQTVTGLGDGTQITVAGITPRVAGDDVGMRLFVRSGADNGKYAHVMSNGTTWWRLDRTLNIGVGTVIELIDPVQGQVLPIAHNTSNTLETALDLSGVFFRHYWAKRPRANDTVIVHGRQSNLNLGSIVFDHFESTTNHGDIAWAWARSGDGSQGSETSFYDCVAIGNRCGFHANGQNVINLHWHGGAAQARQHSFYIPRGFMNVYGTGFSSDVDPVYGQKQVGADITMNQSAGLAVHLLGVYTESPQLFSGSQPVEVIRCHIGNPISAWNSVGTKMPSHTWIEGQQWRPASHKGRAFRCVEIFGTGSTAGIDDPSLTIPEFGDDSGNAYQVIDGSGNGALFIRLDLIGLFGSPLDIIGGDFGQSTIASGAGLSISKSPVFSRPDFLRDATAMLSTCSPGVNSGVDISGDIVVNPAIVDGDWTGGLLPWAAFPFVDRNKPPLRYQNAHWLSRAIMLLAGYQGQSFYAGIAALPPQEFNAVASAVLLAVLDFQDQTHAAADFQNNPSILGKLPRIGTDQAGTRQRLAGGQGTGAGHGGTVDIEVAPPGAAGTQQNPHAVAVRIDDTTVAGQTPLQVLVDAVLKRITEGAADSGGTGFKVLRVPN